MSTQPMGSGSIGAWLRYVGLLAALLAFIAAGYLGFRAFATTPNPGAIDLYALAVVAGVASFFSPCAFPLLPAYLSFSYLTGQDESISHSRASRVLKLGLAASLGVMTFDLVLGVIIAALGTGVAEALSISGPEPSAFVRAFRGGVGVALMILGSAQLAGWSMKPTFVDALAYHTRPEREGRRKPFSSLFLYGLGYNAAGMGCTAPILAGLMVFALSTGGFASALGAFALFSVTMGALMLTVSGLVAASQRTLIARLNAATPNIKMAASILMVLVGLFNLYTAVNLGLFQRLFFPS
jgi:cytochrome c-type biogenesis protein